MSAGLTDSELSNLYCHRGHQIRPDHRRLSAASAPLSGWASHTGTIETATRMTATTLTTGRLVRPEQVVEDPYRQGGRALSERIDMEKSALETDRPGRVVLHGLLDLRPTLPLERIAMAIDEAVARALAASAYGPRYRRPDWTARPHWAMSSSLCDRSAEE